MILRSGVDIVEIRRLDEVNPAIRERFIRRVFTEREIELAGGSSASLAGRFAAKEAVSKALGTGIGYVRWREIEIQRGLAGEPRLVLHGRAQEVARHLGLQTWTVSISHGREHAVAMAVAIGEEGDGIQ
ncbi:MAG TPA: holo-[acyl-carrier-protein] synthase [Anaerolinea thermolimosa]|uniref:Holo-[acyl-carrier-protein] synthase n=1 Tax=Anaerolinea thermolimosa TaxID=229919 RepID=A0A0M8JP83_9CHLR|nr:holo-ACP synthase [Anaerolinea thermolimosa]GAP08718.1 holo-[acyl-carrier-protein] synthase [Anaerolinea thermolimosa]GAP08741.1 holo-[acyl-carrier-protein] synthase [Anaerolinea thermolimosa]HCE16463.1 holo-[acyl-carrier-protein] synthase [Anaerolinea thermolimosa]